MNELLRRKEPQLWLNGARSPWRKAKQSLSLSESDLAQARDSVERYKPLCSQLFTELRGSQTGFCSDLAAVESLQKAMGLADPRYGRFFVKSDHALPVAGSIKARGGIFEVLSFAERLAKDSGLLESDGDRRRLADKDLRQLFSSYTILVGSTGNLGLSVGMAARALGFRAVVHMSSDAKEWKKEYLRSLDVEVVEHCADFTTAVGEAYRASLASPSSHFVDDESSTLLFLGYAAAAYELRSQFEQMGLTVDEKSPLFVYIPCGIGGAPGGITFGLKYVFGDAVHCFFAEPVASPCVLVQLLDPRSPGKSISAVGLDGKTEADGLAVGRASRLTLNLIRPLVSGIFTVRDDDLFRWLYLMQKVEGMTVEPSGTAGLGGPHWITDTAAGYDYQNDCSLQQSIPNATHVVWTTGGLLMPRKEHEAYYARGRAIANGA